MRYDVALVGLGVVGACALHELSRAGARVVAFDGGEPGGGTSGASFAWLNSVHKEPEHYHRLNVAGMAAHRALARELGADGGHHAGGSLEWVDGAQAERELRARVERLVRWGYAAEWIPRERALKLEPGLAIPEHVGKAVFYADDGWLDAPRLIRTVVDAAVARGAEVHPRTAVHSFRTTGSRVERIVTERGELAVGSVLICVGPASQRFVETLGVSVPVDRVPGLLAVTSAVTERVERVVHAPGVHLRPDAGGGLLLGAGDLDAPAARATASADVAPLAQELLKRAGRVFPAARACSIVDHRIGVRPMPGDGHTIAGPLAGVANAWIIATHSGMTLGALLGRLIADEIVRGVASPILEPFRPSRFGTVAAAG
jgi:glycine/D-amino acid oxidase-like deaminating enzyme